MQGGEPQLPDGVSLGEVFAGRYRLDTIIGWGAMGLVVAGHDRRLDIPVAIKVLLAAPTHRSEALRRFVQEARAAARLRSEHVVRVSDIAVHETGVPYIVMERLIGSDLGTVLRTQGPFPVDAAVDHLSQACVGIDEAHRHGIVHRDLKPANLFLVDREGLAPLVKVLDFGIAKRTTAHGDTIDGQQSLPTLPAITERRAILGSPFYMSPEQMEASSDVDARSDIWALGITLYELVVGEPPYTGTSMVHVYSRMTAPGEHPWRARLFEISPNLVPIVSRCLQRERTDRYPNVSLLAADLAPLGSKRARDSEARIKKALSRITGEPVMTDVVASRSARASSSAPGTIATAIQERIVVRWKAMPVLAALATTASAVAVLVHTMTPSPKHDRSVELKPEATASAERPPPEEAATRPEARPPPSPTAIGKETQSPHPPAVPPTPMARAALVKKTVDASSPTVAGRVSSAPPRAVENADAGYDIERVLKERL